MITQDYLKERLDYNPETGIWIWKTHYFKSMIGTRAGSLDCHGYRRIGIDYEEYKEHKLAFLYMKGEWPEIGIDHENTIKDDNSWTNLRKANKSQNNCNRGKQKNNTSGFKGVFFDKRDKSYYAQIRINGKCIPLGRSKDPKVCSQLYIEAQQKYHGNFKNKTLTTKL